MNVRRLLIVGCFFGAACLLCVFRAALLAGPYRAGILADAERIARQIRKIPCRRGKICDRDGAVLVWSELYYDLYWRDYSPKPLKKEDIALLKSVLPDTDLDAPGRLLKSHLKPKELEALAPLLSGLFPLEIKTRSERLMIASDTVRQLAGTTELKEGILCGTSGWELQYELQLRGVPGRFSVMVDRFRRYIPGTFKMLSPPSAGRDIRLPDTLAELERKGALRQ